MPGQPRFTMVVLLVEDMARSVDFYGRLGVVLPPDAADRREPFLTWFDAYMAMVDDPDGNIVLITAG